MKKGALFVFGLLLLLALALLLIGCGASELGGLPSEAGQAFDSWVQDGINEDRQIDYTIVSAQKATGDSRGDETWCIVTDVEIPLFMDSSSHFFLRREELFWGVTYANREREFLEMGCDNW